MYDTFDSFLTTSTWDHHNHEDEERFYCALRTIVHKENFDPEEMRVYMQRKILERYGSEDAFTETVDRYVNAASIIQHYIRATR